MVFLLFLFFLIVSFYLSHKQTDNNRFLICCLFALSLLIGFRDGWPDEDVYVLSFTQFTPKFFNLTMDSRPYGYVEMGYFYLGSIVRSFSSNYRVYLLAMGGLSMFLLYKNLNKYCILPVIGLCDYCARFLLNRDFIQMRSSLAILLIILAIRFVSERKPWHFFAVVALAYTFHHLALVAVPFYFINMLRIRDWQIVVCLILAMLFSQIMPDTIASFVDSYSEDLNYEKYVEAGYVEQALGLRNPMIYFQLGILGLFMFYERRIKPMTIYYELYRSAYFYSCLILILFCNYTALSGRTSTVFATVEMFMLPLILSVVPKNLKFVYNVGFILVLFYFFYAKYLDSMIRIGMG